MGGLWDPNHCSPPTVGDPGRKDQLGNYRREYFEVLRRSSLKASAEKQAQRFEPKGA